jgi:glycine hydroxymethyltransferase
MSYLSKTDPEIFKAINREVIRQETSIELIASENFTSRAVMEAQGSVLTNKYAEGYPAKRWYNGCEFIDQVEQIAIDRAVKLFGSDGANVQPHSGSSANMAVYFALLNPGDTVLAMSLDHGGHLTHGLQQNFSGRFFKFIPYGVSPKDERIDYDIMEKLALEHKPKMITAGASAYPRIIEFERIRKIADKVGALVMVDMAHIAGLVAAGLHPSPVPYSDIVTTTTHKTLRGPRGGLILFKNQYEKAINKQVFPGIQGGPLEHVIAGKAVALKEASEPSFKNYQMQLKKNATALASKLASLGLRIVSGGTDNHLLLVDVSTLNLTGKDAANTLHSARITVNKNLIPFDKQSPMITSGIRLGTAAVTTRGMKEKEIEKIAVWIHQVCSQMGNAAVIEKTGKEVAELCKQFPLYPELYSEALAAQ